MESIIEGNKRISLSDINLVQTAHWSFTNKYVTVYRDDKLKIQTECTIKRLDEIRNGKSSQLWYLDGVKKPFKTVELLIEFYNTQQK